MSSTATEERIQDLQRAYLTLLAKWNRTVNLTALKVDPPDADAIARIIDEPTAASVHVRATDNLAVDLGSGGGSPAIPLKISCPWLAFVLGESRGKKCAFLREVARTLELAVVQGEQCRFDELPAKRPDLAGTADLVTIRAVTPDWPLVSWLLKPGGRVMWFGGTPAAFPAGFDAQAIAAGVIGTKVGASAGQPPLD